MDRATTTRSRSFPTALADVRATTLALYALGLLFNLAAAFLSSGPATADAAFYAAAAQAIAGGRLEVDFLWSFNEVGAVIPAHAHLPVPIGGHWLPGTALAGAPLVWLLGASWPVPALGPALIGALAGPVAWLLARDLGLNRRAAIAAGAIVSVGGPLLPFLGQSDNHAIAAGLGSLGLLLAGRAARGSDRALLGAALAGGAMMLVRNDGLLYVLPLVAGAWLGRHQLSRRTMAAAALVVVTILGTWWLHQLVVFGSLSPSAGGGRSLWILHLDEFNRLGPLTFQDLLARGAPLILASRLDGLSTALVMHALFMAVGGLLLPFAVYAALAFRSRPVLLPTLVFAGAFFAAAVLAFSAHIGNGMYIRSGAALLPATVVLGLAGLDRLLRRVSTPAHVGRITAGALAGVVGLQLLLSAAVGSRVIADLNTRAQEWAWVDRQLETIAGPFDRLLTYDAASAFWYTGHAAVVTPGEPPDTLRTIARAYALDWLVVIGGQTVPSTATLLHGGSLPWLGESAAQLTDANGEPRVAIFAITP